MCYVYNQWYGISCATLYDEWFAECMGNVMGQSLTEL